MAFASSSSKLFANFIGEFADERADRLVKVCGLQRQVEADHGGLAALLRLLPVRLYHRDTSRGLLIDTTKIMMNGKAGKNGGVDGDRTRDLRRDRPAF